MLNVGCCPFPQKIKMISPKLTRKITSTIYVTTGAVVAWSAYSIYYGKEKFYQKFLMPFVHKVDAELAHRLTVAILKYGFIPKSQFRDPPSLESKLHHLTFCNPVGIAAGFDKNGEAVHSLEKIGFGFVEIGSVTPEPQLGNDKPRVFRLLEDEAIINRYGFNSDGHNVVYERLYNLKQAQKSNCVLGINLGANKNSLDPVSDYVKGISKFSDVADYVVINISSPNTPGLRDWQQKEQLEHLLSTVLVARDNLQKIPKPLVFIKLSPDLNTNERKDIATVLNSEKCRVDGLIISNTTVQRSAELAGCYKEENGGLSGRPLRDMSTKMISEMYTFTKGKIPIIGVGGIFDGKDAYEKIKAGATLIQLYTSFVYHGPPVLPLIKQELNELLRADNFSSISEAVGRSSN